MVWADTPQSVIVRVGPDTSEESPNLPLPALQVGAKDRGLIGLLELDRMERLRAPAEQKPPGPRGSEVPDPVRVSARCDEVAITADGQQVDGSLAGLTALAAGDLEDP